MLPGCVVEATAVTGHVRVSEAFSTSAGLEKDLGCGEGIEVITSPKSSTLSTDNIGVVLGKRRRGQWGPRGI